MFVSDSHLNSGYSSVMDWGILPTHGIFNRCVTNLQSHLKTRHNIVCTFSKLKEIVAIGCGFNSANHLYSQIPVVYNISLLTNLLPELISQRFNPKTTAELNTLISEAESETIFEQFPFILQLEDLNDPEFSRAPFLQATYEMVSNASFNTLSVQTQLARIYKSISDSLYNLAIPLTENDYEEYRNTENVTYSIKDHRHLNNIFEETFDDMMFSHAIELRDKLLDQASTLLSAYILSLMSLEAKSEDARDSREFAVRNAGVNLLVEDKDISGNEAIKEAAIYIDIKGDVRAEAISDFSIEPNHWSSGNFKMYIEQRLEPEIVSRFIDDNIIHFNELFIAGEHHPASRLIHYSYLKLLAAHQLTISKLYFFEDLKANHVTPYHDYVNFDQYNPFAANELAEPLFNDILEIIEFYQKGYETTWSDYDLIERNRMFSINHDVYFSQEAAELLDEQFQDELSKLELLISQMWQTYLESV